MIKKILLLLLGMLIRATVVLAYHGTGSRAKGPGSGGTPIPGWGILLLFVVFVFLVYIGWRWWRKVNESAFRK